MKAPGCWIVRYWPNADVKNSPQHSSAERGEADIVGSSVFDPNLTVAPPEERMRANTTALERAFELARSGACISVAEIKQRLKV